MVKWFVVLSGAPLCELLLNRADGTRRLEAPTPAVRRLEAEIERGFTADQIAAVKEWLVVAAQRAVASRGR
jgi:hypothetical protein